MTIPEAVSLVLQAGAYAEDGEIFILDMGESIQIDDLARNMIKLYGLKPDIDIAVEYIGLRPGEKLYEELLISEEGLRKTDNDMIYIGQIEAINPESFESGLQNLKNACEEDDPKIREYVRLLVPTYTPR